VAARAFKTVVLDLEGDVVVVKTDQATVRDGDPPLLSYDFGSFYANLEQLRSTSFMPGSGGGWTVPLLVVEDRR
jgi:hypothetical protein